MEFKPGDDIDVEADGVYCPGKVVRCFNFNGKKHVRVHYIGWDESYDEDVEDLSRIIPGFHSVRRVKVWVMFHEKIPFWPCVAYVRFPSHNNQQGIDYLQQEKKVFVIPYGSSSYFLKFNDKGMWVYCKTVIPFSKDPSKLKTLKGVNVDEFMKEIATNANHLRNDRNSSLCDFEFDGSYIAELKYVRLEKQTKVLDKAELASSNENLSTTHKPITIAPVSKQIDVSEKSKSLAFRSISDVIGGEVEVTNKKKLKSEDSSKRLALKCLQWTANPSVLMTNMINTYNIHNSNNQDNLSQENKISCTQCYMQLDNVSSFLISAEVASSSDHSTFLGTVVNNVDEETLYQDANIPIGGELPRIKKDT